MKICVIIPIYNESRMIASVVSSIKLKLPDVIVLDDGSTDGSQDLARKEGATVIRHDSRSGKGYTLCAGFDYAVKNGYDGVITMDGDGQHDASDLDLFIEAARKNPSGIIIGNRLHEHKNMPLVRLVTNRILSFIISLSTHRNVIDTQCGFRYISRDVLEQVQLKCASFEMETEILMKAAKKGFKIHMVPIKTIYDDEESKINPVKDTIKFFRFFFKEIFAKD